MGVLRHSFSNTEFRFQGGFHSETPICRDVIGVSKAHGGRRSGLKRKNERKPQHPRTGPDAVLRLAIYELRSHLDPRLLALSTDDHREWPRSGFALWATPRQVRPHHKGRQIFVRPQEMGNTSGPDKGSESVAPSGGSSNENDTVTWGSRPRLCICRRSAASLQGLNTGCIYAALFHIHFRRVLPFGLSSRPRTRRVRAEGSVRSVLDRDAALPTDSSTHYARSE